MYRRYDAFGRPLRQPTLAEYQQLSQAYRKLVADHQALRAELQQQHALARNEAQRAVELENELREAQVRVEALEEALTEAKQQDATQAEPEVTLEWHERYLRLQADMDNYKKRQERRFAQQAADERQRILEDMLSLGDHLDLGLQFLRKHPEARSNSVLSGFQDNLESTRRAFLDTLRRHGVEPMEAMGQPFDPHQHEAIGHLYHPTIPEEHVAQVVQPGYTDGGRLLRPARVLISSGQDANHLQPNEDGLSNGI
jgi:molecular chaperone GrpE